MHEGPKYYGKQSPNYTAQRHKVLPRPELPGPCRRSSKQLCTHTCTFQGKVYLHPGDQSRLSFSLEVCMQAGFIINDQYIWALVLNGGYICAYSPNKMRVLNAQPSTIQPQCFPAGVCLLVLTWVPSCMLSCRHSMHVPLLNVLHLPHK